jgi:ABC-2 type transport system permease protein
MLRLMLWQRVQAYRNSLVRGSWRRRMGWLAGLILGGVFIFFVFTASLAVFRLLLFAKPEAVPGVVAGGFTLLLSFALFWGMGTALSDLYLSSDLELLLTAPIKRRDIFWLKLVSEMWQTGAAALISIAILVAYGVAAGVQWSYYLVAAVVWLLVLASVVAAAMILVMLLMRLMPARRAREIYSFLYVISFAAMWIGWMYLSGRGRVSEHLTQLTPQVMAMSSQLAVPPASWAGGLMLAWAHGEWGQVALHGLRLLLVVAAVIGLAFLLFQRSFHHDWAAMHEVAVRERRKADAGQNGTSHAPRALGGRLASWLPWPVRDLAAKDWIIFPRDLRQLSRLIMPLIISLFYVYQFGFASPVAKLMPGVRFWSISLILPVVPLFLALALAAPAIGKEGPNFELLRVAPVSPAALLWSKFWMAALPTTLVAMAVTGVVAEVLKVTTLEGLVVIGLAVVLSLAMTGIAIAFGAITPNFGTSDYRRSAGPLASYGTLLGGGLVWLVLMATVALGALQLPANARIAVMVQHWVRRGPVFLRLLGSPWSLVAILVVDMMVFAGLVILWQLAQHRISAWQPAE